MEVIDPRTGEQFWLRRTRRPVRRYKRKDDREPIYWLTIVIQAVTIGLLI